MKTKGSDTLKQINLLIEAGEKFDFKEGCDHPAVVKWIEAAGEALSGFKNEHREFLLYCITSFGMPGQRVDHRLRILRKVRDRLQERAK